MINSVQDPKKIQAFQKYAENPAEVLLFAEDVLVGKYQEPKRLRRIYLSNVAMYITKQTSLRRKLFYRHFKQLIVAQLSGECLVKSKFVQEEDLLLQSFQYREAIVNIILKCTSNVHPEYVERTILSERLESVKQKKQAAKPGYAESLVKQEETLAQMLARQDRSGKKPHYTLSDLLKEMESSKVEKQAIQILDNYNLVQILKEKQNGGKTYLAGDKERRTRVIIKSIPKKCLETDQDRLQMLRTFRQLVQNLESSYLAKTLALVQTNYRVYIINQHVSDFHLGLQILKFKNLKVPQPQIQFYVGEIAAALGNIHDLGYVYNNLSLEHVRIDSQGHVKLINLEKAVEIYSPFKRFLPTQYSSPEKLKSAFLNVCASDWWTLGTIMHFMMYGGWPFEAPSEEEYRKNIQEKELVLPASSHSEYSISLLKRLLQKDAYKRIGSKNSYHEILAHPFLKDKSTQYLSRHAQTFSPQKVERLAKDVTALQESFCEELQENSSVKAQLNGWELILNA